MRHNPELSVSRGMNRQRGAVLIVALLILMVVTMIGLSATQSGILQMQMAGNDQVTSEAFQLAESANDYLVSTVSAIPVVGGAGYKICTSGISGCDDTVSLPTGFVASKHAIVIERVAPETMPLPRVLSTSASQFASAAYESSSRYADSATGANVNVVLGILKLTPK